MRLELNEIMIGMYHYFENALQALNPIIVWVGSAIAWILFPHYMFQTYALIICIVIVLDLITKYYSLSRQYGGFRNACQTRVINSRSMWVGTRKKIVSYLIIMVLVGLVDRFEVIEEPMSVIGTIIYMIMFLRESQSILENLYDAGHEEYVDWVLGIIKNKKDDLINKNSKNDD